MSSAPAFMGDVTRLRGRDPGFTEAISQKMRVPERLMVGRRPHGAEEVEEEDEAGRHSRGDPPPSYGMHIPHRLALTDAPDMSPRPMFNPSRPGSAWESQQSAWGQEACRGDPVLSPLRRSYSDTAFEKTPVGTTAPAHSKQALHTPSPRSAARPSPHRSAAIAPQATISAAAPPPPGAPAPPSLLSPQTALQAARQLGQQASQRLLQAVARKYRSRFGRPDPPPAVVSEAPVRSVEQGRKSGTQEAWLSPEDEGGAAVEFIVLRRQVVKMSRRLAGVERQNGERRQTELVLFSLLLSACLLNGWLWIRR